MKTLNFIVLFHLIITVSINTYPINENRSRFRRNIDLISWESADALFKQLFQNRNRQVDQDTRLKRSEVYRTIKPVAGPMNIEQLPAMLSARNVQRYPYSPELDPTIIG